jgi:hypothetical protein
MSDKLGPFVLILNTHITKVMGSSVKQVDNVCIPEVRNFLITILPREHHQLALKTTD